MFNRFPATTALIVLFATVNVCGFVYLGPKFALVCLLELVINAILFDFVELYKRLFL